MKKQLLTIFFAFIFLAGCKLDPPIFPGDVSVVSPILSDTYQPSTTNSTWVYQTFFLGQPVGESTQRITGNTFTINQKLYYEMAITNTGEEPELKYYSKTNGVYTYKEKPVIDDSDKEFEYVREAASVGETWVTTFINDPQTNAPQRGITKMVEKNVTKTVLGRAYQSVIHTQVDLQIDNGNGFESEGKIDFYVAKGIGIIQMDADLLGLAVSSQLKTFTIK